MITSKKIFLLYLVFHKVLKVLTVEFFSSYCLFKFPSVIERLEYFHEIISNNLSIKYYFYKQTLISFFFIGL